MKTALGVAAALVVALPAPTPASSAQSASADWDITRDRQQKLVVAFTAFDNGLAIGVRCRNKAFQVLISGLPEAEGSRRPLRIAFRDEDFQESLWNVGDNAQVAISDMPGPLARNMRTGGTMQIVVPGAGENDRNLRYVVDLPPSNTAIDETLHACGRPLVDPRDEELEALGVEGLLRDVEWARPPELNYAEGRTYSRGFATVTCLTQPDGKLRDCAVETEHPVDGGFGKAAINATRRARLRTKSGGEVPLGMIVFRANFELQTSPVTGSRLPVY